MIFYNSAKSYINDTYFMGGSTWQKVYPTTFNIPASTAYIRYSCRRDDDTAISASDLANARITITNGKIYSVTEDSTAQIQCSKLDAISAYIDNETSVSYIETFLKGDKPFEIRKNNKNEDTVYMHATFAKRLAVIEAFIQDLIMERLSTQGGNIQRDNLTAELGNAYIDTQGNYLIKDSKEANYPLVQITKADITPLSEFTGLGSTGETATATIGASATSTQKLGADINVPNNNSTLTVSESLSIEAYISSGLMVTSCKDEIMLQKLLTARKLI